MSTALRRLRSLPRRRPVLVTGAGTALVACALVITLFAKRHEFATALDAAPYWILGVAVVLHLVWLVARSEAWHVCIRAAVGSVGRRRLFRAASVGYPGNLCNGQFGGGGEDRRPAEIRPGRESPDLGSDRGRVPILVIEAALAALMCFTLVAPLGLPWWLPLVSVGLSVALIVGLTTISRARQRGFWKGLAVMRGMASRNRVIGLVIGADLPQLAGAVGDRRRGVGLFDSASRVGRSWIG